MAEAVRAPFTAYVGAVAERVSEGYVRLSLVTGPQHITFAIPESRV